ncbi:unnamed protein product, partial [Rangifer tarandus platyrhynchus]
PDVGVEAETADDGGKIWAVRARSGRVGSCPSLGPADENGEDLESPPSPGDSAYHRDKVDDFHEARSRAALAKGWSEIESGDEEDGDEKEEVLALDVADEDDEDGESEEGDNDDGGSSVQSEAEASVGPSLSWGQRRNFTTTRTQALQEDDFGVTWVEAFAKPVPQVNEAETRVVKDLAKVSVKEKLKMLRKKSPELLELIGDLKVKLIEMKDELEPLIQLVEQKIIPPEKEANT